MTNIKKIHFIGVSGSGISGVAKLSEKLGYEVSGCDSDDSSAYINNVIKGHSELHVNDADMVVASPALFFSKASIPEIELAKKQNKLLTWQEFLGKHLLKDKKIVCIAGTHGKSTTTAMAGKLLSDNGFDPIVVIGANVPEWGGNFRFGNGEYAVVEADEFNNNFLHYHPEVAVINNIEFDHPDFFKNEDEVRESFAKFTNNLVGKKILITEKDSLNIKFNLKVPGSHNQKNANMVYLLGKALGISESNIINSLESFSGISRRSELIGEKSGIKIYDDYAHHPTAIATTLDGIRQIYKNQKIWAIIEPHGFNRTKTLLSGYRNAFDQADSVIVGPIFKARDSETFGVSPDSIAKASMHKSIVGVDKKEKIFEILSRELKAGDVVVVMGAGKSYLWAKTILENLNTEENSGKSFKDLTTFKIGGKIKYYKEVSNEVEVKNAVTFAKRENLPIFILGDGTDILASDSFFEGLVIKYTGQNITITNEGLVTCDAGVNWDKLVEVCVEKDLQGIECLSGVPGTVGASPIQNIGAYGQELKDTFVSLTAYDIQNEKFIIFRNIDCDFGYRESIFKKKDYWQKYLICSVTLKLNKNKKGDVNYESLKKYLTKNKPTLKDIRNAVLEIRSQKFENPKVAGNAGSFFKNPIIDEVEKNKLAEKYPDIKIFKFGDKFKVSAGWLIENSGWKGKQYKTASVSAKHALVLINKDGLGKARDFITLSDMIMKDVESKFGIKLEREVQLINF